MSEQHVREFKTEATHNLFILLVIEIEPKRRQGTSSVLVGIYPLIVESEMKTFPLLCFDTISCNNRRCYHKATTSH